MLWFIWIYNFFNLNEKIMLISSQLTFAAPVHQSDAKLLNTKIIFIWKPTLVIFKNAAQGKCFTYIELLGELNVDETFLSLAWDTCMVCAPATLCRIFGPSNVWLHIRVGTVWWRVGMIYLNNKKNNDGARHPHCLTSVGEHCHHLMMSNGRCQV